MQRVVPQEELLLPWAADDKAWQQAADDVYKALARNGCLTLQLQSGARHLAALQTAYASVRDVFDAQPVEAKALSALGVAADVGCKDLGYKQVFTYKSGPWQENTISDEQHITLQKAMAAGQDLCASVLGCIAGSRAVRLPPGSFQGILESLPVSTQQWSASLLHAFSYRPATLPAKATDGTSASTTVAMPAEVPCAAHVDRSLLTLVYAPGQAGLQVMDGYGQWQMVDALGEDQVLLMPGHALEYALCGLLTAAQHRVVAAPDGQASRCSLTFKLLPAPAAQVNFGQALDAAGHAVLANRYPPVSGADLMARFSLTHPSVNAATTEAAAEAATLGPRAARPAVLTSAATAAGRVQPAAAPAQLAGTENGSGDQRPNKRSRAAATDQDGKGANPDESVLQQVGMEAQAVPAGQPAGGARGTNGSSSKVSAESSQAVVPARRSTRSGAASKAGGSARMAAQQRLQTDIKEDIVTLKVKDQDGYEATFRIRRTTKMAYLMNAYCKHRGLKPGQMKFILPFAERADPERTPADYELEDGDQLEAYLEQLGD